MNIAISKRVFVRVLIGLAVLAVIGINGVLYYRMKVKPGASSAASGKAESVAIELTLVTAKNCAECFDLNQMIQPLKGNAEFSISKEETVDYDSREGKKLVKKYELDKIPAILVRGDVESVFDLASFLQNLGKQAEDGTLIVSNIPPPYLELGSGEVKGKFKATYLTYKDCAECYDPQLHKQALAALVMMPSEEEFLDYSDPLAQEMIAKYAITSLPTLLLQGELNLYQQLAEVWPTVGTQEEDGTYIFRQGQSLMGIYYDLNSKSVVKPEPVPDQAE
ncbi:hypothetical protein HY477_02930 [Candidatus Uhrbacteria bacterium]|nr:hypothetical protein [Candidatus Uhrbacteria bacterium]